jgi:hypothetical protein
MPERWGEEETRNPVYADDRGFFKVEQCGARGQAQARTKMRRNMAN